MKTSSWLCRDEMDRERVLDMEHRLRPMRMAAMGVIVLALLVTAPLVGWWTTAPVLVAAGLFALAESRLPYVKRPEYIMFGAWAGAEVLIAAAITLAGETGLVAMSWLAIPVVTLSARFSLRGVIVGVTLVLALVLAVGLGANTAAVLDDPTLITAPITVVIAVALLSTALMRSDFEHRSQAVIDQLTGMLNRNALTTRAAELAQQSKVSGEPIGLIVGDLDHFKKINDSRGHATGDAVLTDVAYVLRKRLRAFDLAYRMGGEEFLVLLPGADLEQTAEIAEQLRAGIAANTVGGEHVTMSFGVSASPRGTSFDYDKVFADADAGLYEAKRSGRNRVCRSAPEVGELHPGLAETAA